MMPILEGIWIMPAFLFAVIAIVAAGEVHSELKKAPDRTRLRQVVEIGRCLGYGGFMVMGAIIVFPMIYGTITLDDRKATSRQVGCADLMRSLGGALLEYHAKHGQFPEDLRSLESEGIFDFERLDSFEKFNRDGSWTYYWKTDPTEKPSLLLVSSAIGKKKVVFLTDMKLEVLPVKEADALTAKSPTKGIVIMDSGTVVSK